jgi:rhodanese-related sulfurtransferase
MESFTSIDKLKNLIDRDEILSYHPESHYFGEMYEGEENSTTFEIWNSGCCNIYYSLHWNCTWVDVYPTSGTSQGEHDIINVSINTTGLPEGLNLCDIEIFSTGGNGSFIVSVNILHCQIINITVQEAWELLNSTENGIQHPVDVRTDEEWKEEHIDTPAPQNPEHHPLLELQDETMLQEFLSNYKYKTLVVYDEYGINSNVAAQILFDNEFRGLIFNMNEGLEAWRDAGYPVKANTPPGKPTITGPTKIKTGVEYNFTFTASDPEQDYLYYSIHWGDSRKDSIGPFESGEMATMSHTWKNVPSGNYSIGVYTIDRYDDESEWGFLDYKIPKNKITLQNGYLLKQLPILINKFINMQKYIIMHKLITSL